MTTAINDDGSIDIEEQFENPRPKHLLRLREGQMVRARTENHSVLGYVTEEGELEEYDGGETFIGVEVYISVEGDEDRFGTLIYYNDPRGEGLVLDILRSDVDNEELQSLEVVGEE